MTKIAIGTPVFVTVNGGCEEESVQVCAVSLEEATVHLNVRLADLAAVGLTVPRLDVNSPVQSHGDARYTVTIVPSGSIKVVIGEDDLVRLQERCREIDGDGRAAE